MYVLDIRRGDSEKFPKNTLLRVLNDNVLVYILINCHLLREGFCASQTVSITNLSLYRVSV